MKKKTKIKAGDVVVVAICLFIIVICLFPMINIAARSLSSADALIKNKVSFWPVGFNLDAYKTILTDDKYTRSLLWTAILTVVYTIISMFMTVICAYPLTYENLKGRGIFNALIIFTMYFNAGTIPNYLLFKDLGLLDNPLVLVLPSCLSVFNMIVMRSFFYGIPVALREAAEIDGAGPIKILTSIYLPLSTPVMATLALFYAVGRWNGYQDALMYLLKASEYHPIQLHLYNILQNVTNVEIATQEGFSTPGLSETLKAATVMFATVPILLVYPWLQRYFIAGTTLGGVKE